MKILVAVDGSPYTKRMLAWLAANDWFNGQNQFTLFHGVTALPHRAASLAGPDLVHTYYEDDAETVFRPVRAYLAEHHVAADFIHRVGQAGELLAGEAEQGRYDLVVMGSHGHGALATLVLGSVTTQVLARCRTPVLVIR